MPTLLETSLGGYWHKHSSNKQSLC